jgi:PAS domain S-box-containing protein
MAQVDARWLAAMIASSEEAIVSETLDGVVASWNPGAERLFGYPAAEMIGQRLTRLFPPERLAEETDLLARLARGERIEHFETVRVRKDGRRIAVSVTLSPIHDAEGRVIGASKVAREVTERNQARQLLEERRQWLEGMLRSLGAGVIAVDRGGRVSFMNPVAERLTGWVQAAAVGRAIDSVVWLVEQGGRRQLENPITGTLERGHPVTGDDHAALISRDGVEYPVEATAAPIHDTRGEVLGAVMVLHDVTELRRPGLTQNGLAAIVDSSDDAIVSKTLDGTVMSWNPAAERLFGYSASEMVGRPITVVFPPDRLAEEVEFLARLGRGERIEHYETVRVRKDGRAIDVSVTLSPIRDGQGRITGVSKIARDIGERKQADRKLAELMQSEQAALREAMEANRLKDEFLATLSHELRTPINAVVSWAQLLATGKLDAQETARAIEVIVRNSRLQAELMDQLFDLSGISMGRLRLDVGPVNLVEVISTAAESIRPAVAVKNLTLTTRLDAREVMVMGDRARLQQVAWNLLTNALKFTPSGGRIEVRLDADATFARFVVTDTGVGIAPDLLGSVFEQFRQADGSASRRYGGLGLGLAIVRNLVELHGGSVWAESRGVATGAQFTVELPRLRGHLHGMRAVVSAKEPAATGERLDLTAFRVLVVDDDRDSREVVARVLGAAGAAVCEAESAASALQAARAERFDVLVADIGMPYTDGYQLMSELHRQSTPLPGIALTAFARSTDRDRALAAGYLLHLAKPVSGEELCRAVSEAVARARGVR